MTTAAPTATPRRTAPPSVLRRATPADHPLIYSSWLRGQREVAPWSHVVAAEYHREQRAWIDRCLAEGTTWVMCHPGDPSEVIAWTCVGPGPVVHWLYVFRAWRRRGVGSALQRLVSPGPELVTTAWSKHSSWIARRLRLIWRTR